MSRPRYRLVELAEEFTLIAENADTLAECDRWNRDAEQMRVCARLTDKDPEGMADTAKAFISAGNRKLAALEDEIHAERARRWSVKR